MIPGPTEILAARRRIRGLVDLTPLRHSEWLSSRMGARAALKLESVQRTGSFKIRGAVNALARIPDREPVVTASAGNHGRAIAQAAAALGLRATVFAPRDAPRAKLDAIRRHGADLRGTATYDEAEAAARAFADGNGSTYISPYNHADVIAGAGTIGLEIFDASPDTDTIVLPVGGGGLVSGVAIAAKAISPRVRIVGVEAAASTAMSASVRAGRIVSIDPQPTLADGLAGNLEPSSMTFEIVRRHVDELVTVTEEELAEAIRALVREEHLIAEGAGAAAVAALLAGKIGSGGTVTAIVTGSNIDLEPLAGILGSSQGGVGDLGG